MEQFKILTQKELKALSQEETKAYYKKYEDYLKTKMAIELREEAEYEKVQAEKNRKKVNLENYLVTCLIGRRNSEDLNLRTSIQTILPKKK